jgi:hypothetical protein
MIRKLEGAEVQQRRGASFIPCSYRARTEMLRSIAAWKRAEMSNCALNITQFQWTSSCLRVRTRACRVNRPIHHAIRKTANSGQPSDVIGAPRELADPARNADHERT